MPIVLQPGNTLTKTDNILRRHGVLSNSASTDPHHCAAFNQLNNQPAYRLAAFHTNTYT